MTKRTCRNCRHVDKWADEPPCNECSAHDLFEEAERMSEEGTVKTWLDECAMMVIQGELASGVLPTNDKESGGLAVMCYSIAAAMLAEKLRRETEATTMPPKCGQEETK